MSFPVYLVPTLAGVADGDVVEVGGDEARHAVVVRRSRVGESVILSDGRGGRATGAIESADKRLMRVRLARVAQDPEPVPALWVVQALPKGERGERAVEVLTEVGVARIVPWAAERSIGQWRGERAEKSLAKWRSTARESGKQARRSWAVEVSPLVHTAELADLLHDADLALVLHESSALPLVDVEVPIEGTIVLVVGPEGGLTNHELEALQAAGGLPVRMGSEIMRTSTAGMAAAAAILSRTPRWSSVSRPPPPS
jgi:16S rRNA (uracil1498-N3)-methyltransferase